MPLTGAFAASRERAISFRDTDVSVSYDAGSGGTCAGAFAVLRGFLDNRVELADELDLSRSSAPHELVAVAHRRWGPRMPARLRGAFALLVWDRGSRRGLVAVDHLGAGSVVYRRSGGHLVLATELRDLLPLLEAAPFVDERALVGWLVDGTGEADATPLAGVRRLSGGHVLRLSPGPQEPERYWAPRYRGVRPVMPPDAAHELRGGLERAVARCRRRGGPHGILLSGGLDSATVAAVSGSAGTSLVAYSVVFPEHPAADESVLVAERASVLSISSRRVSFRRGGTLAASLRYLDAWRLPPASPNLFFHEPLLELARREGIASMLDGQGGDELFGASRYLAADRLRAGRPAEVRRLLRLMIDPSDANSPRAARQLFHEVALKGALPAWVHRWARRRDPARYSPHWLTEVGSALHAGGRSRWSWKELSGPRWWAYLADLLTSGRERAGAHDFLRHMFSDAELIGSHPLLEDIDLVEAVLELPPELAFHARYDRPLLREAVADLLPDRIRLRAGKSYFNDVFADAVHEADDAAIRRLLAPGAEIGRYVRPELVERLRAVPPARRGGRETWLLWRLAVTEAWLRMQEAPSFAQDALERWSLPEPRFELAGVDSG